jgi:hypothetical protein
MSIPKEKFSCNENTENGGTHLWINNEYNEPSIHILGQWENGIRKELVVCLEGEHLQEFKRQVAEL